MPAANEKPTGSRCSGVVVQQSTETLVSTHSTDMPRRLAVNQFVGQPLMIPLAMVVGDEFRDRSSMMTFAERA